MNAEDAKALEDRIVTWVAEAPELIATLLYRQLNRVREMRMDGIDGRIQRLTAKAEIEVNKHPSDKPFSHFIA